MDTISNFLLPLPKTGICHYFKALNLSFESFVIIYTCLRKLHFLIAFLFFFYLFVYLCIIVFCLLLYLMQFICYCPCMFFVIKKKKKKILFILKSPEIFRDFPCSNSPWMWLSAQKKESTSTNGLKRHENNKFLWRCNNDRSGNWQFCQLYRNMS